MRKLSPWSDFGPCGLSLKAIWSVAAATAPGGGRAVATPLPMGRPQDLRQWLAGSIFTIRRGLPSFWIALRRPNQPCHNHRSHELPF